MNNNFSIESVRLVAPPERIRAEQSITICVEVGVVDAKSKKSKIFSGIAVTSDASEEGLVEAQKRAIRNALEQEYKVFSEDVVLATGKVGGAQVIEKLKAEGKEAKTTELEVLCNEQHQRTLDDLCSELGQNSIDISNENVATFYCIKSALNRLLNP